MAAPFIDQPLLTDQSTDETTSTAVKLGGQVRDVTVYVVAGAGVSAGVVTIEEAHDPDYSGTWAEVTTVTTSAASVCNAVHLSGTYKALRTRISTAIVGGTISTRVVAAEA